MSVRTFVITFYYGSGSAKAKSYDSHGPGSATLPVTLAAGMRLTIGIVIVYLDAPLLDCCPALGDGVPHLVRHLRGPELRYQRAETAEGRSFRFTVINPYRQIG